MKRGRARAVRGPSLEPHERDRESEVLSLSSPAASPSWVTYEVLKRGFTTLSASRTIGELAEEGRGQFT